MKGLIIAAIAVVMVGFVAVARPAQSGNELFAQAMVKETTEGDLAEAIKIYESIVARYPMDQALVARTLVRIGLCHLRKGNAAEAQKAFSRVLRDYKNQKEPVAEANARLAELEDARDGKRRGAIHGRVTEGGQNCEAGVAALKAVYNDGQRVLTSLLKVRTNSRGEFDLSPLRPGAYFVAAGLLARSSSGCGRNGPYGAAVFFPDTLDQRQARAVEVRPGVSVSNLEIRIGTAPVRRVRGTVTGIMPSTEPLDPAKEQGLIVTLTMENEWPAALINLPAAVRVERNGSFEFRGFPPGTYVLWASPDHGNVGHVSIEVGDHDLDGVEIPMVPGLTLSGRFVIEPQTPGAPYPAREPWFRVMLRRDPPIRGSTFYYTDAPRDSDHSFKFTHAFGSLPQETGVYGPSGTDQPLPKGNYRVSVEPILAPPTAPEGLTPVIPMTLQRPAPDLEGTYVKSIRLGEVDVLNDGLRLDEQPRQELVIVIGSNPGTLEGRVVNARKEPVPLATVVLIPEGGIRFRVDHRFTAADASGRFRLKNIPPGDYKIFAWQDVESGAWEDPDFVRLYETRGKSIHIKEGDRQIIDVISIPTRP